MSVCLSVCACVSLCLSVWPPCVSASLRRLPPNFIHALKIFPGRFVGQCRSAGLIERAGVRSRHGFFHDCSNMTVWPRTNLLHHCEREHKITAAQKSAAA